MRGEAGLVPIRANVGHPSVPPGLLPVPSGLCQALPQLYLGQLDGFIELVQGTLEVRDLWRMVGRVWSVLSWVDSPATLLKGGLSGDPSAGKKLGRQAGTSQANSTEMSITPTAYASQPSGEPATHAQPPGMRAAQMGHSRLAARGYPGMWG